MSRLITNSIRSTSASADAITFDGSGNATFPANITCSGTATGFGGGRAHNLIINGAMNVAQRGTSSTSSGFHTVDRFEMEYTGTDEAPTQAQVDVASGTTPYTLGFRKAFKITNGNQTSGAGAADRIRYRYKFEAQDLANSGWNYVSSSSNVTLSFWIKSSVAQNFYGQFLTMDGSQQGYTFETGSLTADTWTKVTKTIPGNSNITIDNDTGIGIQFDFFAFLGTDSTGTMTLNQWAAYSGTARTPDNTSTWYTTNDATLELTGVLLEVGDSASDYPHLSYADELPKCQRYYYIWRVYSSGSYVWMGQSNGSDKIWGTIKTFPVQMRAIPTSTINGSSFFPVGANQSVGGHSAFSSYAFDFNSQYDLQGTWSGAAGIDTDAVVVFANTTSHYFDASAEL